MKTLKQHLEDAEKKYSRGCDSVYPIMEMIFREAVKKWLQEHRKQENSKREDSCNCYKCTNAWPKILKIDELIGELEQAE